jgi:hypothetical protein
MRNDELKSVERGAFFTGLSCNICRFVILGMIDDGHLD